MPGAFSTASSRSRWLLAGTAVMVLVAVGLVVAFRPGSSSRLTAGGLEQDGPAPALAAKGWLNSAPLTPAELKGKVVLYDIWTYSCVNCVRTLPYVRSWWDRYRSDGLVVIGIHSPEFDFEKVHSNVAAAVRRLGVTWPVALDDDMTIWNAFNNQYWPAKYLADRQGQIRFTHFGEGNYGQTEDAIRILLSVPASAPRAAPPGPSPDVRTQSVSAAITEETYLGSARGTGAATLAGNWQSDAEKIESRAAGSSIELPYQAREANLVMATAGGPAHPIDVLVTLDGRPLSPAYRTSQTRVDASGRTYVQVTAADLYRLVFGPGIEQHTVRLTAEAPGLQAFAFTFGA
jgi:thiol-disulfide isomerase/thioredoxin